MIFGIYFAYGNRSMFNVMVMGNVFPVKTKVIRPLWMAKNVREIRGYHGNRSMESLEMSSHLMSGPLPKNPLMASLEWASRPL